MDLITYIKMWSSVILVLLTTAFSTSQRTSRQGGWDIRLAVPGEPGNDYPTLGGIPKTSFTCAGKTPGYYADIETNCQAFRVCTSGSTYGFQSFLCPNGTLFNQAVFVCDWWMNVNCQNSQQYINNNNQKFGNLKIGSQFMNDIKKMLTHPMRNPYDKSAMKSNYVVMQEYRAPSGQLFPSSAPLISNQKRAPENYYVPSVKIVQSNFLNSNSFHDNAESASTVSPLYSVPAKNVQPPLRNIEVFQRQKQTGQYVQTNQNGQYIPPTGIQSGKYVQPTDNQSGKYVHQSSQSGQYYQHPHIQNNQHQTQTENLINKGLASRLTQHQNSQHTTPTQQQQIRQNENYYQGNTQLNQQVNQAQSQIGYQRGQIRQFVDNTQSNMGKQAEFDISYSKQQYNINQDHQNNHKTTVQFSPEVNGKIRAEAKQNLVSKSYGPGTVIAKTLTFNRIIQEPKNGSPKSRITFKTWIVKPSKAAKIVAETTPYTYNNPTNSPAAEKLIVEPTAYYYNKPTTRAQKIISSPEPYYYNPPTITTPAEKLVSESGYVYSKPTIAAKQVTESEGYVYNRPTLAAKQVTEPEGYVYNRPTIAAKQITAPTQPSRLYLKPSPSPTVASRLYLAPTTFKPLARLYLPASVQPEFSRQYLSPNLIPQSDFQSAKLQASPSTPIPAIVSPNNDKSSFSLIKHSRINTIHNNSTFTDILTKEKLDITVNDIVKDTRNILGTAQPQQFAQIQEKPHEQDDEHNEDYAEDNYLTSAGSYTESGEILSTTTPTQEISKSSRLIQKPSSDLEPPEETYNSGNNNNNRLANLPFFMEPSVPTNTIERTVSLKISIPEKTAAYLFNNSNDNNFDKLEILNTGSSNYLVLTNKLAQSTAPSFIPLGKLIVDKDSNFSNSQALVFSFLADSINQAKAYNNIAQQNIAQSHYQDINNEELAKITNKVAQLTSAQYNAGSHTNNNQHLNQVPVSSSVQNINNNQLGKSAKYTNNNSQNTQQQINEQAQKFQSEQSFSSLFQNGKNILNHDQNEIYSGQLYQVPVPDVSSIYNGQSSSKLITQNNIRQESGEAADLHQHKESVNNHNSPTQSSAEVEIIQSQSLPVPEPAPAKLQAAPNQQIFDSQEDQSLLGNFVNNGNGISAQLSDKIVGTISHPSEENKFVTYKKDQSYYVYTKFDNFNNGIVQSNSNNGQSAKLRQNNGENVVTFQFIPSVSYQLEDEKDQQRLLNDFQINEFGSPKNGDNGFHDNGNSVLTSNVEYSVQHPVSGQRSGQYNSVGDSLYSGPSSYSAPQASVGRLEQQRISATQSSNHANVEQFEDRNNNGYAKMTPSPSFSFE